MSSLQKSISIPLLALMMSFLAFSIDAVLPALENIGSYLQVTQKNQNQHIITSIFLGLAIGQLIYGPVSDRIGRKLSIYIGFVFFTIGTILCLWARNMETMIFGRILQGFGLSSNRIVCMALIRDVFKGKEMAKVMSMIMTVFILIPILAPSLGQLILEFGDWKSIFVFVFVFALIVTLIFAFKQKETLKPEDRIPLTYTNTKNAFLEIIRNKQAFNYTLIAGFIFAAFMAYLNMSQEIFQNLYKKGDAFPYYFALVAFSVGLSSFLNGRLVDRFGMYKIVRWALFTTIFFSAILSMAVFIFGVPSFLLFIGIFIPLMLGVGFLFGNLNSIAMEPLGHIAGIGASVIGSLSTLVAVPISAYVGSLYQDNLEPLAYGFLLLGLISLVISERTIKASKA
jgi:DHA1 family bicyclomycin/chloramphenicol resistance-like MFS transporter